MDHEAAVQWTRRSGFARRWEETSLPGGCIGSGLGGPARGTAAVLLPPPPPPLEVTRYLLCIYLEKF